MQRYERSINILKSVYTPLTFREIQIKTSYSSLNGYHQGNKWSHMLVKVWGEDPIPNGGDGNWWNQMETSQKPKLELLHEPDIPCLGIYPKDSISGCRYFLLI